MGSLILYFLPTILALGIITSYEDIKEGKIRNKYVVAALALSVLIHTTLILFKIIDLRYAWFAAIYVLISLIIGVVIWLFGMWSAGDAKLYVAFMSLIPLTTYKPGNINLQTFTLLIITILPVFVYLLFGMLIKSSMKHKIVALKKTLNWKYLLSLLLTVFSISWLTNYLFSYAGILTNIIYNIIAITTIALILQKILQEQMLAFLLLVAVLRAFLNKGYILTHTFLITFVIMTTGYAITRLFIIDLAGVYTRKVNVYQLQPGMTPAEAITKQGVKSQLDESWFAFAKKKREMFLDTTRNLSNEEIKRIQKAHGEGKLHFNNLLVKQAISFAPFIFLGVLITLIVQTNIITFLKALLGQVF